MGNIYVDFLVGRIMAREKHQLREVTPKKMLCLFNMCPRIYEADRDSYLIVGKRVNPKYAGLKKKVGEGEIMIEVPPDLIDKREP